MNTSGASGRLLVTAWRFVLASSPGDLPFFRPDSDPLAGDDDLFCLTCMERAEDLPADLVHKELVFLWIRLPRCLMALLVGSALAVSGAVYQALFRNPLVSPDILGRLGRVYVRGGPGAHPGFECLSAWSRSLSFFFRDYVAVCLSLGLATGDFHQTGDRAGFSWYRGDVVFQCPAHGGEIFFRPL